MNDATKAEKKQASASPRDQIVDYLGDMRAFAVSLTRDRSRADDLVQDTIVKAWNKIDTFEPDSNLRAWLFTILRNTFYSDLRKRRREVSDSDGAMAERLSEKPHHDGRLALSDFATALGKLQEEQREALILVGASGFSYQEAAEMCGVAVGTIKSRVNRGRALLAEMLDLKEDEAFELTDKATMAVVAAPAVSGTKMV